MSITKQLKVLSTLAQEGHPAIYTQEFIEHVEMLYRQSIALKDLPENKKRSLSMPPYEKERPPHAIPLSEYPKVGDIIRCTDDEVQWRDAGLCTDGWDARSFNNYESLYEIVSRA